VRCGTMKRLRYSSQQSVLYSARPAFTRFSLILFLIRYFAQRLKSSKG
jgi:hypothetical protein